MILLPSTSIVLIWRLLPGETEGEGGREVKERGSEMGDGRERERKERKGGRREEGGRGRNGGRGPSDPMNTAINH